MRIYLRSRRRDALDGARRYRAGGAVPGPLRAAGGAPPHSRDAPRRRPPGLVLRSRLGRDPVPGDGDGHRGRQPRDRLPRRRARAGERPAPRARGGHPGQERGDADGPDRPPPHRLSRARLAGLAEHAAAARQARVRILLELHGSPVALSAPSDRGALAGGDPRVMGAGRRALFHVHRAAEHTGAGAGAAGMAYRIRGHLRGARGDELHLPSADHRPTLPAGMLAGADRPRAPHPARMDRDARRDRDPHPTPLPRGERAGPGPPLP
jgi:hypothetical protein